MKKIFIILLVFFFAVSVNAQTYLISDGGTVNNACSGTFYDDGGAGSNYSNKVDYTMTFCAPAGQIIYFDFASYDIANNDYLYIYDGATTGDPLIATIENTSGSGYINSTGTCLTFRFDSGNSGNASGWDAAISCCAANDEICNAIAMALDGTCETGEDNSCARDDWTMGCATSGNTLWYTFTPDPGSNTIDVSFANETFGGDVEMMLMSGSCSAPTGVSSLCGASSNTYTWSGLSSTETYYLSVGTADGDEGVFDICITQSWTDVCGDLLCGDTEDCLSCQGDCGPCPEPAGGPYFHPVTGIQSTYTGICMVNTCTGSYYDDGGDGGAYSNNVNQILRTFCPDVAGNCITATFNDIHLEYTNGPPTAGCYDYILIKDGAAQTSPNIWGGCGDLLVPEYQTVAGTIDAANTYTSTDASGCLTFVFSSGASNTGYWEGFDISLSCSACAGGPTGTDDNDCSSSAVICSDATTSSSSTGPGISSEGCGSCVTSENYTNWHYFEITADGELELSIDPIGGDDYDFALYQSDDCSALGSPVRCSYAAGATSTGMDAAYSDLSEDVNGDSWVAPLTVSVGEAYFLMVNLWSAGGSGYDLDWTLNDGASLDCTILPVELIDFNGESNNKNEVVLKWITMSEENNDKFIVEKSIDGITFEVLTEIKGNGNSNKQLNYSTLDKDPFEGYNYYRLKQIDYNGMHQYSGMILVNNIPKGHISIHPNPANDVINIQGEDIHKVTIWNSVGDVVKELNGNGNNDLKLSLNLESGVYYLSVQSQAGITMHKLIINSIK